MAFTLASATNRNFEVGHFTWLQGPWLEVLALPSNRCRKIYQIKTLVFCCLQLGQLELMQFCMFRL